MPFRNSLSNQMRPPCISTRLLVMFNPRPVPGASRGFAIIGAEEFLEDLGLIFKADANAIILHPQMHNPLGAFRVPLIVGRLGADEDLATFRRVFVRIADKIGQHLPHPSAVCPDLRQLGGN